MPNVGDLVERRRDRHEVLRATASVGVVTAQSPSSSQALHSRALVSVSSVPKVLLETMNSVVAGSRPGERRRGVGRVDVADEPALEPVLAVGRQRLVGHHRTEVGAADADVDDRPDALAGDAGPGAAADLGRRTRRPGAAPRGRRRRRPGRRPRGACPRESRSAVCSTARSSVTLMCSPANIASRRRVDPDLVGEVEQRGQHVVVEQRLRQVDVEVGRGEASAGRPGRGRRRTSRAGRARSPSASAVSRVHASVDVGSTGASLTGPPAVPPRGPRSTDSSSSSQALMNLSTPSLIRTSITSS